MATKAKKEKLYRSVPHRGTEKKILIYSLYSHTGFGIIVDLTRRSISITDITYIKLNRFYKELISNYFL